MTSANVEPDNEPDEHLVRALVHDLDAGFLQLVETYRQVVFATALKVSGRWADAEDLTAESFLRAYRALSGYRQSRILALRPRSWLLTIALNLWRNQQRDAARRPAFEELRPPDLPTHDPADALADVERVVTRRETDRELTELLTELPHEQHAAIVLRHVIDLPVAEIAHVLGRPTGTVKSDISRGLRRLRDLYPRHARSGPTRAPTCADPPRPEPAERLRARGTRSRRTPVETGVETGGETDAAARPEH